MARSEARLASTTCGRSRDKRRERTALPKKALDADVSHFRARRS
jgi:hypothetical protein